MDRRTFLKITGMGSLSFAAGCTSEAEKTLFTLVQAPDDMVTGAPGWYASTCRECPAGCGIIAKNREGRIIKIEGNPLHPINQGRLCMRGQAALQRIYNPDRIKTPLLKDNNRWRPLSFPQAQKILKQKAVDTAQKGLDRIRMLTEIAGESLLNLFTEAMKQWHSPAPVVFEPYAYEPLKTANEKVFGVKGLASYNMENADLLISFGADFLETWLSPVEYARKFKAMHAIKNGNKHPFFHISPYQTLTAANADLWFPCNPGSEAAVALGLIRNALETGRGQSLPEPLRSALTRTAKPYTANRVVELSGLSPRQFQILATRLMRSQKPLILGTGTGSPGGNALQTNISVNFLNLILDPELKHIDFDRRHRVEIAAARSEVIDFFKELSSKPATLLLLNNTNPAFTLPPESGVTEALKADSLFVVSFSNFMDETTEQADLVFPVRLPLETWGEYEGKSGVESTLQPAMGRLTAAPEIGDVFLESAFENSPFGGTFKAYLYEHLVGKEYILNEAGWVQALRQGLIFSRPAAGRPKQATPPAVLDALHSISEPVSSKLVFIGTPSLRFFDGRGANLPWLCEIPDPLTQVAWQTPVRMHPKTLTEYKLTQGDIVQIRSKWGQLEAPVYETEGVRPNVVVMDIGQGHRAYGRYAKETGLNPTRLFPPEPEPISGGPRFSAHPASIHRTDRMMTLAHTDGSRIQHGRKIALSVSLAELKHKKTPEKPGLTMHDFPLTLPLPEGYDPAKDIYPPHDHEDYRWAMVVDLDKCIGCSACAAACYAENNLGVVGVQRIIEGREMAWLQVERYHDPEHMEKVMFLPMMCQHCDNAPCESVCPVYAPHHSKEGLNNQIYNRCIGTRFCAQNCPYKVRRFNWFDWKWPEPLHLQLNPNVTVRSKGVMEKCSFCIQRIKAAHGVAKNEKRMIQDGEVVPACVQTCPTGALTFGNLMDQKSSVRTLANNLRAYQVMGYLNTKPAVIYLKKVVQNI